MPNSFCCYLNSSLKIQVTLNGGIFTQTGPGIGPAARRPSCSGSLSISDTLTVREAPAGFLRISFQERK